MESSQERALVEELMADFGFDAESAAGMVSVAKKVHAREGRFSFEGVRRLASEAYAQDPLLRLWWDGELPNSPSV
ncbi:hypothetical protein ACFVOR_37485 [Streptomyces sp. NPDC057837]|uniref:hypothetical protein n=1 Tax=Streptomyces sp. NPDC057837 TaxID=3346260 RepID=UPI00367F3214